MRLAGNGTGEVRIVIGGGAARSVDPANGLPVFDESNTTITVTDENGTQLAQGTTSVTLPVAAGKKITVKAVVTTAAGEWRGVTEHTVTEGTNTVAVKLSKAPNVMGNLFFDVADSLNPREFKLKLRFRNGTIFNKPILFGGNHTTLVTARDNIGRTYLLYHNDSGTKHLTRFDVEYPIGFIGSDKENIYIADDGFSSEYTNENWRLNGNKNRIAAFNRETRDLTFSDTDATWYAEFEYKKPNTKVLLWEKSGNDMCYWTSTDGTEGHTPTNELFPDSSSEKPTDVFCYDPRR